MDKFHILKLFGADDGFAAIVIGSNKRRLTFNHTLLYLPSNYEDRLWQCYLEAKNWIPSYTRGLKTIVNFQGVVTKKGGPHGPPFFKSYVRLPEPSEEDGW